MKPATFIRKSFAVVLLSLTVLFILSLPFDHVIIWTPWTVYGVILTIAAGFGQGFHLLFTDDPSEEHILVLTPEQVAEAEAEIDAIDRYERLTA